jgi:hypothetical protein
MRYLKTFSTWINEQNSSDSFSSYDIINENVFFQRGINEALKLQIDREKDELVVVSDLDGKLASRETFHNKAILKEKGFKWNGTQWTIPSDQLELAKSTISLVNRAEYLIDTLEQLEEIIKGSELDKNALLKSKLDSYIEDLANATDEKALSDEIRKYLDFFSKFYNYSFFNRIMIYIQRPDATRVASYKKWQEKKRQVKKGALGISIFVPIIKKTDATKDVGEIETKREDLPIELGDKPSEEMRDFLAGFKVGTVFDISDTEAISPEGEIPDVPDWWGENTPSETADELFGYISNVASDLGIKLTLEDSKSGEKGYAAGDHINISSDVAGVGRLSVMIHEIAHELMHFKKSSIFYQGDEVRASKELKELQAESVSYVVLRHYDLPAKHHTTYLALWRANKDEIRNNLESISRVAQFIIEKVDEEAKTNNK